MSKRVAIVQSCYIPWKGFFDIIGLVDHFIIFDDVQYARRHWHNRNRIMGREGPIWLTIPVNSKGKFHQNIDEVTVSEPWADKHWRTIQSNYARAPFIKLYKDWLGDLYEAAGKLERLSDINALFLREICAKLGIQTTFSWSSSYTVEGQKTDRLLMLCKSVGASTYLSGPSAKDYFESEKFLAAGIGVEWMDYSGYPEYPQNGSPFEHGVSIVDLLLQTGREAPNYMKWAARRAQTELSTAAS